MANLYVPEQEKPDVLRDKTAERYRAFFEHSTEAIWCLEFSEPVALNLRASEQIEVFYRAGYLSECNDVMARKHGTERAEDLIGAPLTQLLPPSEARSVGYLEAFIAADYRLTDAESREFGEDGQPKWFLNSLVGIGENGFLKRVWGTQRDVTGLKHTELALRVSEERYHRLVELSPDAIMIHSEGVVTFLNPAGMRLIGATSASQIIGMPVVNLVARSHQQALSERLAAMEKGEPGQPIELKYRRLDGQEVDCEATSVPFRNGDGYSVQVVIHDTSERMRSQQALEEANKRAITDYERLVERIALLGQTLGQARDLTAIFRAVRDFAVVSLPCDGLVITLFDPEKKGIRRAAYVWADDSEFDTSEIPDFPVGEGLTGRAIKSGAVVIDNEFRQNLPPNFIAIGDCNVGSMPQSALSAPMAVMGRTVGCIEIQSYRLGAYSEDHGSVTRMAANLAANAVENVALIEREREKAEQLRQSQKMEAVGQLAGGVAHDFNNLLTIITGYSELSLRHLDEKDPLRKNVEEVQKASRRAASLTRQLLAFSRKQILQAKVIHLNSIVEDMEKMLRRVIGEDIDLTTALSESVCTVKADPGQIEQVILNLAVNARDAMPQGGQLKVETSRVYLDQNYADSHMAVKVGRYVMLAVSDTGCGMDAEIQGRVFEPFFTTKEQGKGTGLGLSTVYGIVKQTGGHVWVHSEVGQGTTFKVYLPLSEEAANDFSEVTIKPGLSGGRETVLLVEDEEMVRNLCCAILKESGYQVHVATNGEEACRICDEEPGTIDLMVTDVVMPRMSGRVLAERAKASRPKMRVLYMSGYTDDAIVRHGVLDEDLSFLQKPFSPDSFARKVRDVLDATGVEKTA